MKRYSLFSSLGLVFCATLFSGELAPQKLDDWTGYALEHFLKEKDGVISTKRRHIDIDSPSSRFGKQASAHFIRNRAMQCRRTTNSQYLHQSLSRNGNGTFQRCGERRQGHLCERRRQMEQGPLEFNGV